MSGLTLCAFAPLDGFNDTCIPGLGFPYVPHSADGHRVTGRKPISVYFSADGYLTAFGVGLTNAKHAAPESTWQIPPSPLLGDWFTTVTLRDPNTVCGNATFPSKVRTPTLLFFPW